MATSSANGFISGVHVAGCRRYFFAAKAPPANSPNRNTRVTKLRNRWRFGFFFLRCAVPGAGIAATVVVAARGATT